MSKVSFEKIRSCPEIKTYIETADKALLTLGFTDHSFAHVMRCAETASYILESMGYDEHSCELGKIAAYMHDIGNVINRVDHAQSGAIMAFRILDKMGMDAPDIAKIISAIGNHDESTAFPVNEIAAALILADKSDVRRTRVRNNDFASFDIHDRVNYAVESSALELNREEKTVSLILKIDSSLSSVMDYFEIFLGRMLLCRRAADFFELKFHLEINGARLL